MNIMRHFFMIFIHCVVVVVDDVFEVVLVCLVKVLLTICLPLTWQIHKIQLPGHNVWKLLEMSHLSFSILAFSTNFCPIKSDLSGNTVWQYWIILYSVWKSPKMSHLTFFGIYSELLATQNVNVARSLAML